MELHHTGGPHCHTLPKYFMPVLSQLTSALRYIHGAGLACRTLDPTKILILGKSRLLVNCGGIFDVLTYDPNSSNPMAAMTVYQQEDLVSLGRYGIFALLEVSVLRCAESCWRCRAIVSLQSSGRTCSRAWSSSPQTTATTCVTSSCISSPTHRH